MVCYNWLYFIVSFATVLLTGISSSMSQYEPAQRKDIAFELSRTINHCVSRTDTDHIIFNGCIDWHSSVHGTWGLIAYMRATGDRRYMELVKQKLNPSDIAAEHEFMRSNPQFEMPYGRAWFLRLAIDYHRLTGKDDLKKFADDMLFSLIRYYSTIQVNPRSKSYSSASWAFINMYDYAAYTKNVIAQRFVVRVIKERFYIDNPRCSNRLEEGHFMAVCTNWAWLVSKVVKGADFQKWVERFYTINRYPQPVYRPRNWHHYGLNFSRAWGLWGLYQATGNQKFAALYDAHFKASYSDPDNWRGSYRGVGHWVPQFGMYALQPLFGQDKGR